MSDEQHRMNVASTGLVGMEGKFLDGHGLHYVRITRH